jgi:hypothetical protein
VWIGLQPESNQFVKSLHEMIVSLTTLRFMVSSTISLKSTCLETQIKLVEGEFVESQSQLESEFDLITSRSLNFDKSQTSQFKMKTLDPE